MTEPPTPTYQAHTDLARLRTDTVGSLLRPAALKKVWKDYLAGGVDEAARTAVEDGAIGDVVAAQEAHGLQLVNDGEFRRVNYQDSFAEVAGLPRWRERWTGRDGTGSVRDGGSVGHHGADPSLSGQQQVTEPLRLVRNRPLDEYRFVAERTALPATVTVLGPDRVLQAIDATTSREVYPDADAVADGVVATLREIVGGLRTAGCRYVHIDEPGFTSYVDGEALAVIEARGDDPAALLERSIAAGNALFDAFPDVVFGVHVCRGNRRSQWHREGRYDAIAEQVFGKLRCDRLLLEYDTERAGGFEPLRFLAPGTVAVLGLISTKTPELEPADTMMRRIEEAARYVPVERLAISPQCGFASGMEGNLLGIDDQWRKLELMLDVAGRVWG